jgi:hypothetical protein
MRTLKAMKGQSRCQVSDMAKDWRGEECRKNRGARLFAQDNLHPIAYSLGEGSETRTA